MNKSSFMVWKSNNHNRKWPTKISESKMYYMVFMYYRKTKVFWVHSHRYKGFLYTVYVGSTMLVLVWPHGL